jgi:hypothetical protein
MHQIAKYLSDSRQSHGEAILYLVHYRKKTCNLGLKLKPDPKKGFECYCDTDFSGNWNKEFAPVAPSTAKSQSGWISFYSGCTVSWASKFSISSCAVYHWGQVHCHVASTTWRHFCYQPATKKEGVRLQGHLYWALCLLLGVWRQLRCCRTHKASKATPKEHAHKSLLSSFSSTYAQGTHQIFPLDTKDQIADALTKALAQNDFQHHRRYMCSA